MKIKTKYNLGDVVCPITKSGYSKFIKCETCNGIGSVTIKESDKNLQCPTCYGRRGEDKYVYDKWQPCIDSMSDIGKISTEEYAPRYSRENRTLCMISNTGVGSGTCWNENDLFGTIEEAQTECDKRNEEEKKDE